MNMNYRVQTIAVYFCCGVGLVLPSCSGKHEARETIRYHTVNDSALALARNGDIVLRCGKDELSKLFSRLNARDQQYSHCGILSRTDSGLYVTHIIGGNDNPGGYIRYEPVQSFIRPEQHTRWALVRYDLDSVAQQRFLYNMHLALKQRTRFDAAFDLATDDRMYCSELVYKLLLRATADSVYLSPTISSSGKKYVAIDNLFDNTHSTTVCAISYK
ncbi:MAG: hypothetical protein JNL13_14575 [Chitinophagaceae bacterium]|nr:hypothetical protein [Chitinophagaceae bacterium]